MKHQLDCEAARAELAARTYGEPDGHLTVALEAHLESCAACRSARSEMTVARGFLDRGTPPLGDLGGELEPGASREVAQDVVRRVRRRGAWRSVLFGVAAALLGFVTLGALGTRAEVSGDRLVLSFDLPFAAPAEPASDDWRESVRGIARAEVAEQTASLRDLHELQMYDLRVREEQERLKLVHAIDRVRRHDREGFATILAALQRGSEKENRITREALVELASLVQVEQEN